MPAAAARIHRLLTGYPGMCLLAMVSPLWHRIVNKRVLEHDPYDMSRVNAK